MKKGFLVTVVFSSLLLASIPFQANAYETGGVTWSWVKNPKCGWMDSCYQMKVRPQKNCSNGLYVELNEMDKRGNILGFTNATLGSIRKGQQAILTFPSLESSARTARLSKMSCY